MTKNQWAVDVLEANMDGFTNEERLKYLGDVTRHGCASGCVSGVIYYREIKPFFVNNLDEILTAVEDFDYEMGTHVLGKCDASQVPEKAVWLVVELTADRMAQELTEDAMEY